MMGEPKVGRLQTELFWGGVYISIFLLIYAYQIFRPGVHYDELYDFRGEGLSQFVAAGRFGLALYRHVFCEGMLPWTAGMLAGVFLSLSIVWQTHLLRLTSPLMRLLYGSFYFACIQFSTHLSFSQQSDVVALGMLISTAAVYLYSRGARGKCAAIVCLASALSIYQSLWLCFITLWLACALRNPNHVPGMKAMAKLGAVSLAALALYSVLKWCSVQWVFGPSWSGLGYQQAATSWDFFLESGWRIRLLMIYGFWVKSFFLNVAGCVYPGQQVYLSTLFPVGYLLWKSFRLSGAKRALWRSALVAMCWLMPFAMIPLLFASDWIWPRMGLAEPIAFASLWCLALADGAMERHKPLKIAVAVFLPLALLKNTYVAADFARREACQWDCVRMEMLRIRAYCSMVAYERRLPDYQIVIQTPSGSNNLARLFVRRYLGMKNIRFYSEADTPEEYRAAFREMPSWPHAEMAKVEDGKILLRWEHNEKYDPGN